MRATTSLTSTTSTTSVTSVTSSFTTSTPSIPTTIPAPAVSTAFTTTYLSSLNIVSNATGLVAEIQITLSSLLHVKASGGHTAYALSRRLKLLEPKTFRHQGALSSEMLENLASGVLQVLR